MKKYFLFTLLFLPLLTLAQSNYKSAYAVDMKGDTLRGYIDYKEWGHNPKTVSFKTTKTDKVRDLGLTDIKYFEIDGYVSYCAYKVAISLNSVDISSPSATADTASETETVFLKTIQTGKNLTLYAYKDGLKERFYINDSGMNVPTELLYGIYQQAGNADKVVSKNTFQPQLTAMALKYNAGSDKLLREIQQSAYREDDFAKIVAQINGNTQAQTALKQKRNPATRFFIGTALMWTSLRDGFYYGSPTSKSTSPKIAIGADLITNPDVGHLIFRIELAYASNSFGFSSIEDPIYNIANDQSQTIAVTQRVLFITPQVIYNVYNAARFKVFVDAGYSINILSYPKYDITNIQNGQPTSTTHSTGFPDSKGEYSTFQFKTGMVLNKRLEIYCAYFPGAQVTDSYKYNTNERSFQLGFNWFLGRVAR